MTRPRTLFGQLVLILLVSLVLAQSLTFAFVFTERSLSTRSMMVKYLSADVASSVAILDRLPAAERQAWLERLSRPNYSLRLGAAAPSVPPAAPVSELARTLTASLSQALSQPVTLAGDGEPGAFRLALQLQDGQPVSVDVQPSAVRLSPWLLAALFGQLALLGAGCWVAVRHATRPLAQLAAAARSMKPGRAGTALALGGSREVADAARAFEDMRQRIDEHIAERVEMLAAISHDLQTPITRMRLRADLLGEGALRAKLLGDLAQMQHLVETGLAYARTSQAVDEVVVRTDLAALLESVVSDFQDAGQPVTWLGGPPLTLATRPRALHRAVVNLIDNALKFAGAAEVALALDGGQAVIQVLDRGPGIPPQDLDKVMRPFYRVESSRSRETGGTGLGLAIVQRLLQHGEGELKLAPREGGGLQACIMLPAKPA